MNDVEHDSESVNGTMTYEEHRERWAPILSAAAQGLLFLHYHCAGESRRIGPESGPCITYFGDDLGELRSQGPCAFKKTVIRRAAANAHGCLIQVSKPDPAHYVDIATVAVNFRRNFVIVDTLERHELEWVDFIKSANPKLSILVAAVQSVMQ